VCGCARPLVDSHVARPSCGLAISTTDGRNTQGTAGRRADNIQRSVSVDNEDALTADLRARLPRTTAASVTRVLRKTDQAFDGRRSGHLCCILMPNTTREEADRVGERLLLDLSQVAGDARFSYVVQSVEPALPYIGHAMEPAQPVEGVCHATN
jgi:hypothetical protein